MISMATLEKVKVAMGNHGWHSFVDSDRNEDDAKFLRWCRALPEDWALPADQAQAHSSREELEEQAAEFSWMLAIHAERRGDTSLLIKLMNIPPGVRGMFQDVRLVHLKGRPRREDRQQQQHLERYWMHWEVREYERLLKERESAHYQRIALPVLHDALLIVTARWGWMDHSKRWYPLIGFEDLQKTVWRKNTSYERYLTEHPSLTPPGKNGG